MDNKKKLTDDELEKVAGGYDSDMFYEEHRKEVPDEPPKPETWLQKDKLDDIPPSDRVLFKKRHKEPCCYCKGRRRKKIFNNI